MATRGFNENAALTAILDLTRANLASTQEWVSAEQVNDFIQKVYTQLRTLDDPKKDE